MAQTIGGQTGPTLAADNTYPPLRQGRGGELVITGLHGRFFEQNFRYAVFGGGMVSTSISNATFTSATTGATATPIIGIWNPATSPVNIVILQATIGVTVSAATSTGPGGYVWMSCTGNSAITTGSTPINQRTLATSGSYARFYAGTALTGMTGVLAILRAAALSGGSLNSYSFVGTAVGPTTAAVASLEHVEGSIIVPPGGVVGLFASVTPVAHSAVSGIVWEEVPI